MVDQQAQIPDLAHQEEENYKQNNTTGIISYISDHWEGSSSSSKKFLDKWFFIKYTLCITLSLC